MTPVTIELGNERLLRLAEILDTADALHASKGEPAYKQTFYVHPCGTPACALGHWAAANPDRWILDVYYGRVFSRLSSDYLLAQCEEFGLSDLERAQLFCLDGCNNAKTAKDAAAYIRAFVARRHGYCRNGHKYSENLYVSPTGIRVCRGCSRAAVIRYRKRTSQQVAS